MTAVSTVISDLQWRAITELSKDVGTSATNGLLTVVIKVYPSSWWAKGGVVFVQSLSHVQLFETPCTAVHQGPLSSTVSWSLLKCMPLSWWCYLNTSSPDVLFSFYLQPFPASGSFPVSWLFTSGGQSRGASALASVLPTNIRGLFPLRLTGLIFLQSKGPPQSSPAPQFESINSLVFRLLYGPTLISVYDYWKGWWADLKWQTHPNVPISLSLLFPLSAVNQDSSGISTLSVMGHHLINVLAKK